MQITGFHEIISPAEFEALFSLEKENRLRFLITIQKISNSVPGKRRKSPL